MADKLAQMLNVGGNLPPEILQQQQALNRQQQMAQLLLQQGMQQPQGQMVSGRYVAPSFFQYAAPLFQMYAGKSLAKEGDAEAARIAEALRKRYGEELTQYQNMLNPVQTELAGPTPTGEALMTINLPDKRGANLFAATAYNPALQAVGMKNISQGPKWEKASFTDEKTGRIREGVIDVNSDDPIASFRIGGVKPEMTAYERANIRIKTAELADKGIGVNFGGGLPQGGTVPMGQGGMTQGGMTQGGGQVGQVNMPVANADAKFTPATLPKYEYDPSMSPAQNREAQAKFNDKLRANISNAKESFGLLSTAADTLTSNKPSSGGLQNVGTTVGEFLGYGGEASQADATLKILGEKLTAQVPRFEGPQSDKDTAAYRVAAGDIGNANKPIATRIAAIKTMIELNKKYYPNGDWDSIDIGGPVQRQYSPYVPTVAQDIYRTATGQKASYSPQEFRKTLNPQDQAAFDFVRKNPNHKDTPAIKKVLGIQ